MTILSQTHGHNLHDAQQTILRPESGRSSGGGGFLANVPRVQEEMATPRCVRE